MFLSKVPKVVVDVFVGIFGGRWFRSIEVL